ncbi:large ribosomal subunit protein bL9m-like [Glandiceps talaboti]
MAGLNGLINTARVQTRLLLRSATLMAQPCRTAVVVERLVQPGLSKIGARPKIKPRHKVYKVVKDTRKPPPSEMQLILIQDVQRYGKKGDIVTVSKKVGRNKLLAPGLAVYPLPDNIQEYCLAKQTSDKTESISNLSVMALKTIEFLKKKPVTIAVKDDIKFEISKYHVSDTYESKLGVVVPENAVTLPETPITGFGEYPIQITMNGVETVDTRLIVRPKRINQEQDTENEDDTTETDSDQPS